METIKVGFYYDVQGTIMVEALDVDDAERKVKKMLEDGTIENHPKVKHTNREYDVTGARTMK